MKLGISGQIVQSAILMYMMTTISSIMLRMSIIMEITHAFTQFRLYAIVILLTFMALTVIGTRVKVVVPNSLGGI